MGEIKQLQARFAVVSTAVLIVLLCFVAVTSYLQVRAQDGASTINHAGRQRMLVTQITQYAAQLALRDPNGNEALTRGLLEQAANQLERVNQGLLHGDPMLGIPASSSRAVRAAYGEGGWPLKTRLRRYLQSARSLAKTPAESMSADNPDYLHLRSVAPKLVDSFDVLTREFERDAARQVRWMWMSGVALAGVLVLILLVAWRYVYLPAKREVRSLVRARRRRPQAAGSR